MWDKIFGDLDKMALPSLEVLLQATPGRYNTSAWDSQERKGRTEDRPSTRMEEAIPYPLRYRLKRVGRIDVGRSRDVGTDE